MGMISPVRWRSLRDVRHAVAHDLAGAALEQVVLLVERLAAGGMAQSGQALHQLGLAVAVHAGDAQDLAAVHGQVHMVERLDGGALLLEREVPDREHGRARLLLACARCRS